jgi:hypothetical protein
MTKATTPEAPAPTPLEQLDVQLRVARDHLAAERAQAAARLAALEDEAAALAGAYQQAAREGSAAALDRLAERQRCLPGELARAKIDAQRLYVAWLKAQVGPATEAIQTTAEAVQDNHAEWEAARAKQAELASAAAIARDTERQTKVDVGLAEHELARLVHAAVNPPSPPNIYHQHRPEPRQHEPEKIMRIQGGLRG